MKQVSLHLGDQGTQPADISWDDLQFAVEHLKRAILSRNKERGESGKEKIHFALTKLGRGSVIPTFDYDEQLEPAVKDVSRAVTKRELAGLAPATADHLYAIERRLRDRNIAWTVATGKRKPVKNQFVTRERPLPEPPAFVEGWTVIYGECIRAGGKPPVVRLAMQDGPPLSVKTTREIAQKAAMRLYRIIALKGPAKWRPEDMSVVEFQAEEWIPYEGESIEQSIRSLREVAGGPWHGKGVLETYRQLRKDN